MPETFRRIRNRWYLNVLSHAIPDGRVSHWRGDSDTLWGNILIPDTIRQESDSEYGALVSIGNCEVRSRRFSQRPSLFRAICMNGCIWGRERGHELTLARFGRGALDLAAVEKAIVANIHEQIPLCVKFVETLLGTRSFETKVSMKPVIAQLCRDYRITKPQGSAILQAWRVEKALTPDLGSTLFAVINGVTRAGQLLDNHTWTRFDELGGRLALYGNEKWQSLASRASKLREKQVVDSFATWTPSAN